MNTGQVQIHPTYGRSAPLYDSYIETSDYRAGAAKLVRQIRGINPSARTLLDVGCGSGKYLEQLRQDFDCSGLDFAEDFVAIARHRCPDVPIHHGNMIDFDLGRKFDVISCLFLAIAYTRTVANLERAVASMARHLNPGGVLLFEPWIHPENFWENRLVSQYIDEPGRKISRMYVARREGNLSIYDIHYLLGTSDGVEHFIEREELGLFTHEEYLGALEKAGLATEYDPAGGLFDLHNIGMYRGIMAGS